MSKKITKKQEEKVYRCSVSGEVIPAARVKALKMLGTPEHLWTCVQHSQTRPIKGIYAGEAGTSELLLVSKVYNDSVRSVFKASEDEIRRNTGEDEDE